MFHNLVVSCLSGISKVNPKSFKNNQNSRPLFELAAFHVFVFNSRNSKCKNSDWPFDHKPQRTIFLPFISDVTEPLNLRHSFLYVRPIFK